MPSFCRPCSVAIFRFSCVRLSSVVGRGITGLPGGGGPWFRGTWGSATRPTPACGPRRRLPPRSGRPEAPCRPGIARAWRPGGNVPGSRPRARRRRCSGDGAPPLLLGRLVVQAQGRTELDVQLLDHLGEVLGHFRGDRAQQRPHLAGEVPRGGILYSSTSR